MTDTVEILDAKLKVENALLNQTGSYAGVGAQIKEDVVTVYLRNDTEQAKKKAYDLIGSNKANGHSIRFISSGNITALSCPTSYTAYNRPICGGNSCGHTKIGAGTLGGLVYDATSKKLLGLSNNHVLAASSTYNNPQAVIGDTIFSPGLLDSSGIQYPFGKLYKYVPMNSTTNNFVDCALVEPDSVIDLNPEIIGLGIPQGWEYSEEGMRLIKSGRTSGITEGTIIDKYATLEIDYGGIIIKMSDTIVTGKTADPGDSGAFALNKYNNKVVGLLFAGSSEITCYNRIENVMNALDILILPTDTMPAVQYTTSIDSPEYFVQSLALTAIGIGAVVSILPTIEQQIQLAIHRRF